MPKVTQSPWGQGPYAYNGETLATVTATGGGSFSITAPYQYQTPGFYTISINIIGDGQSVWTQTLATIYPGLQTHPITGIAGTPLDGSTIVTFIQPSVDPGPRDYGVGIDWGDGTESGAFVDGQTNPNGTQRFFAATGAHTYKQAGSYIVTINLIGNPAGWATTTATIAASSG